MDIRLVTNNPYKVVETVEILKGSKVKIVPLEMKIEELQTLNVHNLVKDKLLKAFSSIGRPLIVEHTGLYLNYLNGFPGGLTQIYWDSLRADKFSEMIAASKDTLAIARTIIGYCDGKKIFYFEGEVKGKISDTPKGKRDFQWDCVFIPDGETMTFAEMGERKNEMSMRKKALENLKLHLEK